MKFHTLNSNKFTLFFPIWLGLLLLSCSKNNTTFTGRTYHDMTSLFNYYYNAEELYVETVAALEREYEFQDMGYIDIVHYGDDNSLQRYETDFAEAIRKNDMVIFKHPHTNFVDNCRFLNGKLRFYKQEYILAMQNFDDILNNYTEFDRVDEVYFWKALTYYFQDNLEMAKDVLNEHLIENPEFTAKGKLRGDLAVFQARLAMDEEDYPNAIRFLEENMKYIKNFGRRARAHFLLGQLYEKNEDFARSLTQYKSVKRHTNDYDLIFTSKMKVAQLYIHYQEGQDDEKRIYKYLKRLVRDEKNEEYRDQIYFQFARLEEKKDSLDLCLDYLQKSTSTSVNNNRQKALSYFMAGDIYFYDFQNYPSASAYYDSASQVIPELAPEYQEISRVAKTMQRYIQARETIAYQDSMIWLAGLSEDSLDLVVEAIHQAELKRQAEEEKRRAAEEAANQGPGGVNNDLMRLNQLNQMNQRMNQGNQGRSAGGKWYFDDPSTVRSGMLEFERKWGKRTNEDNWRRKNKAASFASDEAPLDSTELAAQAQADSALMGEYGEKYIYYKDIPKTEDEVDQAHMEVEEALYTLGQIYYQNLNEVDSAVKTFEYQLDRYDNSEFALMARYALYNIYSERGNPVSEAHKSLILNEYPNSIYSYLLQGLDPNDFKEEEQEFIYAYEGLFKAYRTQQYISSLGFSEFLLREYGDKPGLDHAKMHYIRAMSYGYVGLKDSLKTILLRVVEQYRDADVVPIAKETLRLIEAGFPNEGQDSTQLAGVAFPDSIQFEESGENELDPRFQGFDAVIKNSDKVFVLMYLPKEGLTKNDLRNSINGYNQKNHAPLKLKAFVFDYHQTHLLPYITSFKEAGTAKTYIQAFQSSDMGKTTLEKEGAQIFYITQSNFRTAYGNKRMEDYIAFFEEVVDSE